MNSLAKILVLLGLANTNTLLASWYPPGYAVQTSCQNTGIIEVCAINQAYSNYPQLQITYNGFLLNTAWNNISVYVKLNGKTGLFPMINSRYSEKVILGRPITYLCYPADSNGGPGLPLPPGPYQICKYRSTPGGIGGIDWEAEPLPTEIKNLFFYARNEFGIANAWDLELAFTDAYGNWDSNYGNNYVFRFE